MAALALAAAATPGTAEDWPQLLGPTRDGHSGETGLLHDWPEGGPPVLWRRPLGEGFSGVAVAGGRLFTLFAQGGDELAAAFDPRDGSELWRRRIGETFSDPWGNGPRATPTVDGDLVFALASHGQLWALRTQDGEVAWSLDLGATFGPPKLPMAESDVLPTGGIELGPYWGYCSSPLVEGELLIVQPGAGHGKSLVALDKATGETRWTALDHPLSYSSPTAATLAGERQIIMAMTDEIVGLSLGGAVLWRQPWARFTVAQPVVQPPDRVFVSAPNDVGGLLFAARRTQGGWRAEELWRQPLMRSTWGSPVDDHGSILGFDNATLKALAGDGEVSWGHRGLGKGTLIVVEDLIIVLSDRGAVALGRSDESGFHELGRATLLEGPTWTAPSLAHGRLFLRNQQELIAVDLRETATPAAPPATDP